MANQEHYESAKKRVRMLFDFYKHAAIYVTVNLLLLLVNLITEPHTLWFYWPLIFWGIGLASHAFKVYGFSTTSKWEEKKIQEMVEREQAKSHSEDK